MKPLKNVKDTLEERDLLVRYVKEAGKRQSLEKTEEKSMFNQNNKNGNSIFVKKAIKLEMNGQIREEEKDVEI